MTRLVPDHFTAWMNIGMTLVDMRKDAEARVAFDLAYTLSPAKFDGVITSTKEQLRARG